MIVFTSVIKLPDQDIEKEYFRLKSPFSFIGRFLKKIIPIIFFLFLLSCKNSYKPNNLNFDQLVEKGKTYFETGQIDSAVIIYEYIIDLFPNQPHGYYGLGVCKTTNCYNKGKDCNEAIEYFNEVIQMDSTYRKVFYNRGICKTILSDFIGAMNDFNIAIQFDSTDADYFISRGFVKLQLNDTLNACVDFKLAYILGSSKAENIIQNICK